MTAATSHSNSIARKRLQAAIVHIQASVGETLPHMQNEAALVVDDQGILCGIVTDGDVRRAFLKGASHNTPIAEIMTRRPVTVAADTPREIILRLMLTHQIRHIPVVDHTYRPVALE
ncbi:MAG: CBS domain-containing protein, partial [Lentisphaerae bacterium]